MYGYRSVAFVLTVVLLCGASQCVAAQEPFTFVQLCDPQFCRSGSCEEDMAMYALAVEYINELEPDFVLIDGDLVDMLKQWATWDDFLDLSSQFDMPYYCVVGNNDVGTDPDPMLLQDFRDRIGPDWFAFNHKGFLFAGINTQIIKSTALPTDAAAQDSWLTDTLEAAHAAGTPVIVTGHYPLFIGSPVEVENSLNLPLSPGDNCWTCSRQTA